MDPLPPVVNWTDFAAKEMKAPPQLVDGLIYQGSKVAIGGGSKTMKTWMQMDLALSVAYGLPFLGKPTHKGRVLVVNLELQDWASHGRFKAIEVAKQIKREPGESNLDIWNLEGYAAPYDIILPAIQQMAKKQYKLIIIDPVYMIYGDLDENSARDITKLMNAVGRLAKESNAAIVFAAHFSKGNQQAKEAIDRISGSGVFARHPDTLLIFTRHEEEDCFTVEPTLRALPPAEPFVIRWDCPLMIPDALLDPTRLRKGGGPKKKYTIEMVLGALEMGTPMSATVLAKELKCSRRTLYETLIPVMKEHPQITRNGDGEWLLTNLKGDLNHNGSNHQT